MVNHRMYKYAKRTMETVENLIELHLIVTDGEIEIS